MTPIKRRLLYIFRGTLLRLRITWNHGDSITLSVGYHVDKTGSNNKKIWDGSRCKANTTHGPDKVPAAIINKALENLETKVFNAFYKFESEDRIPSVEELKQTINPSAKKTEKKKLSEMINEYVIENSVLRQWGINTTKNINSNLKRLVEVYGDDADLDSIGESEYAKLLNFYLSKKIIFKDREKDEIKTTTGFNNSTINISLRWIRHFINWAVKKNYCTSCGILTYSRYLKSVRPPVVFLEWDELIKLMELDLSGLSNYERTRDFFVFCCFTGLRYSDLRNLKWSNIKDDRIEIVTQKTSDRISINLNKYSKAIIDKYRSEQNNRDNVFTVSGVASYNKLISKIARMAKIDSDVNFVKLSGSKQTIIRKKKWECLSSHSARRTFVCNSLSLGIPADVVMKWTGHKHYNSMKPYIDILSKSKVENMDLYNSLPDLPNINKKTD